MKKIFIVLVAVMLTSPLVADDHCEDIDRYPYISSELALCSTHAYNANRSSNDMNANDREQMNQIIALKSTIITQQLYKQYESLDKLIKKLKTQLEKAVLTANLEASGAKSSGSSSGSSSGFSSNDRNVFMAGVKNCNAEASTAAVFSCLQSNYTTIYNTSGNGTKITSELKKQLANDYNVACNNYPGNNSLCDADKNNKAVNKTGDESAVNKTQCGNQNSINSRDVFQKCLDNLVSIIRKGTESSQKSNMQNQSMNRAFGV
ncbi:MAG: hypothetical protein ACLRFJ_02825 [Alphaproteobacteria bacterium]